MKLEEEIKQKSFNSAYHRMTLNILFTASWLNTQTIRILKPFGITPQQYNVLRILRGQNQKPASVGLIQERMLDKSSNASRLIDKLVEKKLIERKTCPEDRRQVDIKINQKGLDLLEELEPHISQMDNVFKNLTEEEARIAGDLIDKLRG
ncbi:MAG: MarR family transcriptional regulator [Bacteroidota bacterium]|nr:MarR family transcriptional regulator [Bacteroidota bacterium]